MGHAAAKLIRQEFGYIRLMLVSISVCWANFRYGYAQVCPFRKHDNRIVPWILSILSDQLSQSIDIGRYFGDQNAVGPGDDSRFKRCKASVTTKQAKKHGLA